MNAASSSLTIGVFYSPGNGEGWKHLEGISEFLTEGGVVPGIGDRISIKAADQSILGINSQDLKNVLTVKERIFNYSLCDIALVCRYEPF